MHGLEAEYYGQVNFVYLDIDDPANEGFKQALGYRFQPNIFLLDGDGNILEQWLGPIRGQDLRTAIDSAIQ